MKLPHNFSWALLYTAFLALPFVTYGQVSFETVLSSQEIKEDLQFLVRQLDSISSYQGLNQVDWKKDLTHYLDSIGDRSITAGELGWYLEHLIGLMGDRHAKVYLPDFTHTHFLPFVAAPFQKKILAVVYNRQERSYAFAFPSFPYLTAIEGIPIQEFMRLCTPRHRAAPPAARQLRGAKQLKYMSANYSKLGREIKDTLAFSFSNDQGQDTIMHLALEKERRTHITWDYRLSRLSHRERDLNKPEIARAYMKLREDSIAYLHIPQMVEPEEVPNFFPLVDSFLTIAQSQSKALIIDIRGNGGGTRHLIQEIADFVVPPESVVVGNIVRQRAALPLNEDYQKDLHNRFLASLDELNETELKAVLIVLATFRPKHKLDDKKFSPYYVGLLQGDSGVPHYSQPVYLLVNEQTFSAASIFASMFQNIPGCKLAGTQTDGSSGNSDYIDLPHSQMVVKISTMVSFQTDGNLLDGVGTRPDIPIAPSLDQILWKEDFQLESLVEHIHAHH